MYTFGATTDQNSPTFKIHPAKLLRDLRNKGKMSSSQKETKCVPTHVGLQ